MRMVSAAVSKGRHAPLTHLAPREGTRIRAVYDHLMANKGIPLDISLTTAFGSKGGSGYRLAQLRDSYGLDIRCLGYGRWVLAGEWFGPTYIDYIADRLAEADRRAA